MVMFFKMLWTWLTHGRRGRLDIDGTSVLGMRVWPQDIDFNLHMNNGRYFSVADVGRLDWWLRTGVWYRALKRGWRPVAGDSSARFSRSLQPLQRYELHTRMLGWNQKWVFAEHRFISARQVYATVVVRYLFVTRTGPRPSPAQVLAMVAHKAESPALPEWVEVWSHGQDLLSAALKKENA